MKGGSGPSKSGKPKASPSASPPNREPSEPRVKASSPNSKAPEQPASRLLAIGGWAGWSLLNRLPIAIPVTILILFVVGLFFESAVVYAFLAVSTYVLTDLALGLFVTSGRGRFKVFRGWVSGSPAKAYYALLFFIVIAAPLIASIIIFGPDFVFGYTSGLHTLGLILSDLIFSVGTAIFVGCYLAILRH